MEHERERLWELMQGHTACMMVTRDGEHMRGRPMAPYVDGDGRTIRFLSSRTDPKIEEIHREAQVALLFTDHSDRQYVSVSGKARVTADRALVEELWGPAAETWFPGDAQTADVVVIEVEPSAAEYWDNDANVLRTVMEVAKGYLTDEAPDLGENAKLGRTG